MEVSALHERLGIVIGGRTYRAVAELTGFNAETVRRYLQGQAPSVEFLEAVCIRLGVNAHWLITGSGPAQHADVTSHALREANPAQLLSAIADALEQLTDRVERLEVFVQTLETRVRAKVSSSGGGRDGTPGGGAGAGAPGDQADDNALRRDGGQPAAVAARAERIADALARRSSADAH